MVEEGNERKIIGTETGNGCFALVCGEVWDSQSGDGRRLLEGFPEEVRYISGSSVFPLTIADCEISGGAESNRAGNKIILRRGHAVADGAGVDVDIAVGIDFAADARGGFQGALDRCENETGNGLFRHG